MATIKEPTSNNPLHAALSLLDAAAYCDDASVAVEEIKVILKDNFASTQAIRKIHSILILLSKALPLISNSVKGQVASCAPPNSNPSYARSRLQTDSSSTASELVGIPKLELLVKESSANVKSSPTRCQQKRKRSPATISPDKTIVPSDYPTPNNHNYFLIKEAVVAYKTYPQKKQRMSMLKHWEKKGWVPEYKGGERSWNRMAHSLSLGNQLREWKIDKDQKISKTTGGRSPLVSVVQAQRYLQESPQGSTLGADEINDMIQKATRQQDLQNGIHHNPAANSHSYRTTKNYKSLLASLKSTTITQRAVDKTEVREIAEKSIRSTISFMMMTAVTLFQIGDMQAGRPSLNKATAGAKTFERLVSQANNDLPVRPLQSNNIHSTDDSGVYFVSGVNNKKECEWRIAKDEGENNDVKSVYKTTKQSMLFGQRARFTWSASADGTVAPAYVSFLGLSERELPKDSCPDGILVLPIEGLSVGGVDPDCKSVGYIVFVRGGKDQEKQNFRYYQETVFRPYVERKKNLATGVPASEEDRSVSCSDGGGAQLTTLLEEDSLVAADNLLLTLCKHSASRSGAEQYLDLAKIFKNVHRIVKTLTAKSRPCKGFKKKIYDAMMELDKKGDIKFSRDKLHCIIDFIVCLPELLFRSVTPSGVIQGFVEGGAVDRESETWPDFDKIIGTCRRPVAVTEVELIKTHFNTLYDAFVSHGKIPEELFDELGFSEDEDRKGKVRPRRSLAIVHGRAMCYSSEPIRLARNLKLQQQGEIARIKKVDKDNKVKTLLTDNASCESKLPADLLTATFDNFFTCKAPTLKAFVHCRLFTTPSRPADAEWNGIKFKDVKKGTIISAEAGEDTTLVRAMKVKHMPVILRSIEANTEQQDPLTVVGVRPTVLGTICTATVPYHQPSVKSLSEKEEWIAAVRNEVCGVRYAADITIELVQQAERLATHLEVRMDVHLKRIPDPMYWVHWCFRWARKQFTKVSLISCLACHIKKDLSAVRVTESLLSVSIHGFHVIAPDSILEGCYLFYDNQRGCFVRSGKASPTVMHERIKFHEKEAKRSSKGSYGKYPHKSNPNISEGSRIGYFDHLSSFCGLGFDRSNTERLVDTSGNGILDWDDITLDAIKKWKVTGTEKDKRLMLVAYLFELVYDLMLSSHDCVSLNPGFESCHGFYGQD